MNKPLLTLAFILPMSIVAAFFGQGRETGAAILPNNHDSNHPIFCQTIDNPAAGGDFYEQIQGGLYANHLAPVASSFGSPRIFRPVTLPSPPMLHAVPSDRVIAAVPEPSIWKLCFVGVLVIFAMRCRR